MNNFFCLILPYINNIQMSKDGNNKFLTFTHQNKDYFIIFNYEISSNEKDADEETITPSTLNKYIDKFQGEIRNNEAINLSFESEYYSMNVSDNILYWKY